MRIASFNMRSGGSVGHWSAILEAAEPDVLLVQESKDPAVLSLDLLDPLDLHGVTWQPVSHGLWGSAAFLRGHELHPVAVPGFEGWVVGGFIPFGDTVLYIYSVHLPPEARSYIRAANSMLDALGTVVDGASVLLGGDWNVTVSARDPTEERRHRAGELELLARLEREFGLRSAWRAAHPSGPLPQTLRWMREPATPYHCDGVFLPDELTVGVGEVAVLAGDPWLRLSDHNPLVVSWDAASPSSGEPA